MECVDTYKSTEDLIRSIIVTPSGEDYFSCDKQNVSLYDLVSLLLGVDEYGNNALNIYLAHNPPSLMFNFASNSLNYNLIF